VYLGILRKVHAIRSLLLRMTPYQCQSQKQFAPSAIILMHTTGQYRHDVVMKVQQSSIGALTANILGVIMVDSLIAIERLTHL
jgi:hypothetical protein